MKIILALILTVNSYALTLSVVGPCSSKPLFVDTIKLDSEQTVGDVTIDIFDKNSVDYLGSNSHMQSIMNSPYGVDAMEILTGKNLRSHGWCFKVDGQEPPVYPNDVNVSDESDILWYFCYVSYSSGVWDERHLPTHLISPDKFCSPK